VGYDVVCRRFENTLHSVTTYKSKIEMLQIVKTSNLEIQILYVLLGVFIAMFWKRQLVLRLSVVYNNLKTTEEIFVKFDIGDFY
jgi:hypothetical protein